MKLTTEHRMIGSNTYEKKGLISASDLCFCPTNNFDGGILPFKCLTVVCERPSCYQAVTDQEEDTVKLGYNEQEMGLT